MSKQNKNKPEEKYKENGDIEGVPPRLTYRRRKIVKMKKKICEKYPDKYEPWMCLAKLHTPVNGRRRCVRRATKRSLRCRFHGGKSTGPKSGTGKYSIHGKKFLDTYEQFLSDANAIDLVDELAILRACVKKFIDYLEGGYSRNDKVELMEKITYVVDVIGKMAERLRKIHVSYFSMESMYLVVQRLVNLVESTITVCPHCKKPIPRVRENLCKGIMGLCVPDNQPKTKVLDGEMKVLGDNSHGSSS